MGIFYIFLLLGTIIVGAVGLSGGASGLSATDFIRPSPTLTTTAPSSQLVAVAVPPGSVQGNLQINRILIATVTPTPTPTPVPPTPTTAVTVCQSDSTAIECNSCPLIDPNQIYVKPGTTWIPVKEPLCTKSSCIWNDLCSQVPDSDCIKPNRTSCYVTYQGLTDLVDCNPTDLANFVQNGPACLGKPVIYLYPTEPTYISVKLSMPGHVVESIPAYPENGWQNVLAQPNGELTFQGKQYTELYYESSVTHPLPPKDGIVISNNQARQTLIDVTNKLGLNTHEQQELLNYWLPKLKALQSPYLLISVFPNATKEQIDHVGISPEPQTRIQFLLYFKPLQQKINLPELQLPLTPPLRNGFTEVEWGGTIDQ